MEHKCPQCGKLNEDNWPLEINGKIIEGGCQDCWEKQCDESWWEFGRLILLKGAKRMWYIVCIFGGFYLGLLTMALCNAARD